MTPAERMRRYRKRLRVTLRINATHAHAERGLDPYWTPSAAIKALLNIEQLPRAIWEPACGNGAITTVLRSAGHTVISSDICRYDGFAPDFTGDYLTTRAPDGVQGIVTNPPFKKAQAFASKAILDAPYVALLGRLEFLESTRRLSFFRKSPPVRIWVSSRRLPMMHRLGWTGRRSESNHCFAWFVWERGTAADAPAIKWFDWRDAA